MQGKINNKDYNKDKKLSYEHVNKITLNFNDKRRLESFNRIKSYPYGTSVGKVYKEKLLVIIRNDFEIF